MVGRARARGVFRDFLTRIISTISAKNGVHRPARRREREKMTDRNCFATPCNLQGRSHHVSFAQIINSLFHNYHNAFAKMPMTRWSHKTRRRRRRYDAGYQFLPEKKPGPRRRPSRRGTFAREKRSEESIRESHTFVCTNGNRNSSTTRRKSIGRDDVDERASISSTSLTACNIIIARNQSSGRFLIGRAIIVQFFTAGGLATQDSLSIQLIMTRVGRIADTSRAFIARNRPGYHHHIADPSRWPFVKSRVLESAPAPVTRVLPRAKKNRAVVSRRESLSFSHGNSDQL